MSISSDVIYDAGMSTSIQNTDQASIRDRSGAHLGVDTRQPCVPYRYVTAILAFFGFLTAQAARTCFNISLVAMVNNTAENHLGGNESQCPLPRSAANYSSLVTEGPFSWDGTIQSQLLSGFFYGYVVTQFPGGYLSERVGSTWVFGLSVLLPGILTLLHPLLALWDYRALFVTRVVMGMCQGPLYPANQALWGRWAPPLERSRLISLSISGAVLGIMSSMMLSGYLCSLPYLGGWPLPFYVWGGASCVWFVVWRSLAADTPSQSRMISASELCYIEEQTGHLDAKPYRAPPWCRILSGRAFWALTVYLIMDGIGYYVIFSGVPVYMSQVLHYDISQEGQLAAMPFLAALLTAIISGPLADYILSKQWMTTTGVRKLFTLIGEGSTAVALIGMGLADCDQVLVVALLIVGYGLNGLTAAGVAVVTLDMAPQYAGTLLGMTNFIDNLGGFISPTVVGAITDNQGDKTKWQSVFFLTGGCYMLGIIVFLLLGSAELQPWAVLDPEDDLESEETNEDNDSRPLVIS